MTPRRSPESQAVDDYLERLAPEFRAALQRMREVIRSAAPDAEEVISYRMPAFRQDGMLVYYGAFEDHCSLFTGGTEGIRRKFAAELQPFVSGRGTLRFTPEKPIPADLVRRIVKARVAENSARRRK